MRLIEKFTWFFFKIISRVYWYLWRKNIIDNLAHAGKNIYISKGCTLTPKNIFIKDNVYVGIGCVFQSTNSNIYIGNDVMFGPSVHIHGGDHRVDIIGRVMRSIRTDEKLPKNDKDVVIEDDVWVGANTIILKGVKIGQGSVIGGGTIITKDIKPYSIITNNVLLKNRDRFTKEEIILHEKLLKEDKPDV